jgi:DNA-binding Lrp family transcriptional regulator
MSVNIDETDEKIIRILQADSRKAFVEIANEIGLSESAVRRRVKNLVDSSMIKRFTLELGASDKTSAITLISVEVVYEITGQYDIAAIIAAPAIVEINKCIDDIRKIEGVSDTNTVIILKTIR